MNRQTLQSLASDWTRMAKNDIRTKIKEFMNEVDTTPRELAYALAISEGELQQILEGNGEITLSTFAKLLIATGNALEIKPIGATPMGDYNHIPSREMRMPPMPPQFHHEPRPAMRTQRNAPTENRENHPYDFGRDFNPRFNREFEDFDNDIEDDEDDEPMFIPQPRDPRTGRFQARPHTEPRVNQPTPSKFEAMSYDKLVEIIENNLWDSEINLRTATKENLVKFLDEKDKKITERKRIREAESDPTVRDFKERVKKNLKNNPHLREYLKNLLGE